MTDFRMKDLFRSYKQRLDRCTNDRKYQKVYHQNSSKKIIWKTIQNHDKQWKKEKKKNTLKRKSSLDPFFAEDKIIRIGGRLKRSIYNENLLHLIVLP